MKLIKIRKAVSIFVLFLFILMFVGPERLSGFLSQALPPFQFLPALIRTLTEPHLFFTVGLILLVAGTLVFGRVYCSFLCPLGTMQDLVGALKRKLGFKTRFVYSKPHDFLRLAILAASALALVAGMLTILNLLDPFSITGRIVSHFLQPAVTGIYNLAIMLLKPFDIYPYPKQMHLVSFDAAGITLIFILVLAWFAAKHGRLYCNTVCPVGTFLGLLSKMSIFKLTLDPKGCSECVRCETACKAGCIDSETASIDMSRCVACFNCLDICAHAAVSYRPSFGNTRERQWSPARRGLVFGGLSAVAAFFLAWHSNIRIFFGANIARADAPIIPPGSKNLSRYTQACTACSLCVSACPTAVLEPAFLDYGIEGFLQPKLNYDKSYCDFECNACGRVCPTGAILPMGLDEKQLTQIGEARLLEDVCVVFVDDRNCGACGEVCPTHAISFTDKNNVLYPEIDKKYCIGCGSCRIACPTQPRSIVIEAHAVHKTAEKNILKAQPAGEQKPAGGDFPF